MRIHKVYTRTGDQGMTDLVGGERVAKDSLRIESYGTVDELQSFLGLLRAALSESIENGDCREIVGYIHRVQQDLFDLGSMLSTPPQHADRVKNPITPERIAWLEETMDRWNEELPPLRSFVLSGGGRFSALGHVARTVCRRCERIVLRLSREEEVPPEPLRYLNRLSDFLFVLARHLAKVFGEDEPLWETPLRA
ncbi:MAG TPA: cob(I)yrinic acid a,c-diamide adenosyltransferase [Thermoanaerobaculia bacterium]|jgi:cob(I)alamin adenosyltransferase|nr:cob(I)yrinic acid a,c-diamide adenosyltransferase [Thermoanaerobaculia bacterium]